MTPLKKSNNSTAILPQQTVDEFRQEMQTAGIHYSGEIVPDGKLHRFHIEGHKQGSLNGAYTFHLDNRPAGWFMDYTTGLSQTWNSGGGFKVSYALIKQIEDTKQQREAEIRQGHKSAALKAEEIWPKSKLITKQGEHT